MKLTKANEVYLYMVPLRFIYATAENRTEQHRLIKLYKYNLLSRILKRSITEKDLYFNPMGKPFLNLPNFSFSISHSKSTYAIAWINQALPIGLDIEDKTRTVKLATAKSVLSLDEYTTWQKNNYSNAFFLQQWTRKEAYIKAKGIGISTDINQFNFLKFTSNKAEHLYRCCQDKQLYQFLDIEAPQQVGSLCSFYQHEKISVTQLNYLSDLSGTI